MEKHGFKMVLMKAMIINLMSVSVLFIQSKTNTEQTVHELSRQYLKYYHSGQVSELPGFWAKWVEFEDQTAGIAGEALLIQGRDKVKKELTRLFGAVEGLNFSPEFGFSSGNFTVSAGSISYQISISENSKRKVTFDVVTILEFEAGKVVKHTDYADYQNMIKQLNK